MPLLFSSISRGTAVLAKHATCPGNFIEVTEEVLTKITDDGKLTYSHGRFLIHYIANNGIIYLCITDDEFERSRAFAFLAEIKRRFEMTYGARARTALPYAMNSDFAPLLAAEMRGFSMPNLSPGYNQERSETLPGSFGSGGGGGGGYGAIGDAGRNGRMLAVQKQSEDLKKIMVKNIDALTTRGEKLELLIDRSENLEAGSVSFRTRSRNLERHMFWKNMKMTLMVVAVLMRDNTATRITMGDDKRKVIEKLVRKVLDHRDDKIVSVVQKCLDRGYDYRKMKDRLNDEIRDGSKSGKLAESVLEEFPTAKKRPKFEEEKQETNGKEAANGDAKKPKMDPALIEQDLKVKELMSQAQRAIEERKKQLNLPMTPATSGLNRTMLQSSKLAPAEAEKYMALTIDKQSRANELRAKIANRFPSALATLSSLESAAAGGLAKPTPLLLDNAGRQVDPFGNELLVPKQTPTLKANIRAEKRELFRRAQLEVEQPMKPPPSADDADAPAFLDPRLSQRGATRQRRLFKFHEKGEFEQLANKQRAKAKLEKLQAEISQAAKNTGISSAVKLAMVAPKQSDTSDREVPLMEWWDSVVLNGKDYDCLPSVSDDQTNAVDYSQTISHLVEHPIQLKPPDEAMQPQYIKVFLTKKEKKKIRRQNRKEAQKEKTEKVRLGLEPPPEPKMKISNLMRVLGSEAVQDPTKMEAHVRKQMAERQRKHEQANLERQLTSEQRSAKKIKKMHEDVSLGVHVAIYRVKSLAHPAKKFKIEMNAKQLQMTGVIVIHKDINIIIVEGGPKQQKFYKRLVLNRIKWEDEIVGQKKDADKDAEGERNKCDLVWEGLVKKRNFGEVRCKLVTLEKQARELLEKHNVAHYWDMAYSGAVLLQDAEEKFI